MSLLSWSFCLLVRTIDQIQLIIIIVHVCSPFLSRCSSTHPPTLPALPLWRFQKLLLVYNMRSQNVRRCSILSHSQLLIIQMQPQPDISPILQIAQKNQLKSLNITDFQIFNGYRLYKIEWVQAQDRQPRYKWEKLQNLYPHPYIKSVLRYEEQNASFIKAKQSQWLQYFFNRQVTQPLECFDRKKFESDDQQMPPDSDSEFRLKAKRGKRSKSVKNSKAQSKAVSKRINKKRTNRKAKQPQCSKPAIEEEEQECYGNWSIQIPYIELSETPALGQVVEMRQEKQLVQLGKLEGKKEAKELLSGHSNSEQQHQQSQSQNANESEGQERQRKSCNFFQSSELDKIKQSFKEVISEESFDQRPPNIRRLINQHMIALRVQGSAELLESDSFASQEESQGERRAEAREEEGKDVCDQELALQDRMEVSEVEEREDQEYRYVYENLLSAEIFKHQPLPVITRVNRVITCGSLTLFSVRVAGNQEQTQKFVLPQVVSQFYREVLDQYDSDH